MNTAELETLIRTILSEKLAPTPPAPQQEQGIFCDVGSAIDAAHQAFLRYQQCPLKTRSAIISALRETLAPELATLAEESATETGMGNKEDKYLKNKAALENTPGIEDLTTSALTGDGGMVLFEYSPFGVIGAVAPSTNPTETIINNSISMLAAGNSVYFSPHPGAKKVSLKLIARIEEIAYRCSGIRNLVVTVAEPTFEATQQMMSHPLIAVLAITGGPGIVAMGMKSGKKVIGAGAGNPPCIVDETADLVKAAEDIISGAAFDYNLPCIAEKSLIVVASVADRLIQQMQDFDALLLSRQEADTLRTVCLPDGAANKKLVGKSPAALLAAAGLAVPPRPPRLLIAEVEANDPWVTCEQLMPVLPIVRVADFDSALALALRVEEGLHHTAIMHSQNVSRLNLAARTLQTSILSKWPVLRGNRRRRRRVYHLHHRHANRRRHHLRADVRPPAALRVDQRFFHSLTGGACIPFLCKRASTAARAAWPRCSALAISTSGSSATASWRARRCLTDCAPRCPPATASACSAILHRIRPFTPWRKGYADAGPASAGGDRLRRRLGDGCRQGYRLVQPAGRSACRHLRGDPHHQRYRFGSDQRLRHQRPGKRDQVPAVP